MCNFVQIHSLGRKWRPGIVALRCTRPREFAEDVAHIVVGSKDDRRRDLRAARVHLGVAGLQCTLSPYLLSSQRNLSIQGTYTDILHLYCHRPSGWYN